MRECWINVYVIGLVTIHGERWPTPSDAKRYSSGQVALPAYRLHVRLKAPALLDSDALAAGKAGEGSHIHQESIR